MRLIDADELYRKVMKIINGNAGDKIWAVAYAIAGAETAEAEHIKHGKWLDTRRPCYIDGAKAMFHRFSERSEIIAPSPMIGGHSGGVIRWTVAVVEYENGTVSEVAVSKVRFSDGGNFSSTKFIPLEILGDTENE